MTFRQIAEPAPALTDKREHRLPGICRIVRASHEVPRKLAQEFRHGDTASTCGLLATAGGKRPPGSGVGRPPVRLAAAS